MTDAFSITITGSNNDSNLVLASASASITDSAGTTGTHSHTFEINTSDVSGFTLDVNGLIAANETAKQSAAAAAAATAAAAAAADLAELQSYLPVLDNSTALLNHGVGLDVKHLATSGNARSIIYNKYGDLLTVNYDSTMPFSNPEGHSISIFRFGDYTNSEFKELKAGHKNTLLTADDFKGFDPVESHVGRNTNVAPVHGIALRHYPAGDISDGFPAVTKLFVALAYGLFCWDYDDSTKYNAYNSKLTNGRLIMNKITCGIDTGFNYGLLTKTNGAGKEYDGHNAHDLLFNLSGDLHISSGSLGNYDIGWEGDISGVLTDERSVVKYVTDSKLKAVLANSDAEPISWTNNTDVPLLARGLRNACGLALDASNEVWCVNMGADGNVHADISTPYSEPFWNSNPACTLYKLPRSQSDLRYGFPYAFISATDLSVNGTDVSANNLVRMPEKAEGSTDSLGRLMPKFTNPFTKEELANDASFVQHANAIFPAHSSPLQIVFNQLGSDGKLIYDGVSDQRFVKTRGATLTNDFALITLKGGWAKLNGGWSPNEDVSGEGAGHKLVTYDISDGVVKDFFNDPSGSFSSGQTKYAGLNVDGAPIYGFTGLMGPTFRPVGVNFDNNGNVMITQSYDYFLPERRSKESIIALYKPS